MAVTRMIEQYSSIKKRYSEEILMFRLGDFYEMFYDDAKKVAKELEITLTGRNSGDGERAPMCGVPYHSCEAYIERLIKKGYKVAICEQNGKPQKGGLVDRKVVRVITPGTIVEGSMLDESSNNYICSAYLGKNEATVCFCDVSTGFLNLIQLNSELENSLIDEIGKYDPREILSNNNIYALKKLRTFIEKRIEARLETLDEEFNLQANREAIITHFGVKQIPKEVMKNDSSIYALGVLISYLKKTQMTGLENINKINMFEESEHMSIDLNTRRNLELIETMRNREKKGSLLGSLDKTKTSMGKRLIKSWIEQPLINKDKIIYRQNAIEELKNDMLICDKLRDELSKIPDIERLLTRVIYGSANAKDLRLLSNAIELLPEIKNALKDINSEMLKKISNGLDGLDSTYQLIDNAIVDDPPTTVKDGGIIKEGYSKEVDNLRADISDGANIIVKIEAGERKKTGIPKLKIGYNKVFGYYIEVTNSFKDKIPQNYIRKQTLRGCERYITEELTQLEGRVLNSKEKIKQVEFDIFDEIRRTTALKLNEIKRVAKYLSALDVLCSFAKVACDRNYVRPKIETDGKIAIKDGRHPVVEQMLDGMPFVPNSTLIDNEKNRTLIITGPNMAGKSTYMRQVALIVLMAQTGSFVPSSSASIGVVDNIFTRVGASDDLTSGQSTFMVEMNEVSDILKKSTKNSLLILDEIGRGTSTFDGMSIAKSVLEYVSNDKYLGAKTLFSTHYHELTEMERESDNIKNYNVSVKKRGDNITFLRRIIRGGADDSYGIEVAKLAGLPDAIIDRAKLILENLESGEKPKLITHKSKPEITENNGINASAKAIEKLKMIDTDTLTPIEGLNILCELKKSIK